MTTDPLALYARVIGEVSASPDWREAVADHIRRVLAAPTDREAARVLEPWYRHWADGETWALRDARAVRMAALTPPAPRW